MKRFCQKFEGEKKCAILEVATKHRKRKFPWLLKYQATKLRKIALKRKQECPSETPKSSLFSKIPYDLIKNMLIYLTDDELFYYRGISSVFYEVYFCQNPEGVPLCNGYGRATRGGFPVSLSVDIEKRASFNYARALSLALRGRRFPRARHIVAVFGLKRNPVLWMDCLDKIHFPQLSRLILYPPRKYGLGNSLPPSPPWHPHVMYLELREAYPQYIAHSLKMYPNLQTLKARVQTWDTSIDWGIINDAEYPVFFPLKEIVIEIRGWRRYQNWGSFNSVTFPNLERFTIHELDLYTMRKSYPAASEIYEEILRKGINILGEQKFKLDFEVLKNHNHCKFF